MNIIVVSGFLGSGKTTFLLQAIDVLYAKKHSVSLIINEIGELGIDNTLFKRIGAHVREILGGCICCTSAAGFCQAVEDLKKTDDPEYILIEPSGIADPGQIEEALLQFHERDDQLKTIALLDSDRIDVILEAVRPLTVATVSMARTILITKTDIGGPSGLETATQFAATINPTADIIPISLSGPLDQTLMEELLGCSKT